jgi:DNA-binding LacI/PurR family transcriptional regulator
MYPSIVLRVKTPSHQPPRSPGQYLYRRIADDLRAGMEDGRYARGTRLPSLDELATHFKVNRITVRRALQDLRAAGLIYSVPAQGVYVAETADRAAPTRRSPRVVGLLSRVLFPATIGPYHQAILAGVQEELVGRKANLLLLPAAHLKTARETIELACHSSADAMIYVGDMEPDLLRQLLRQAPPAVLLDHQRRGSHTDAVIPDNRLGASLAVAHLVGLGHRRLAVICGRESDPATQERLAGVRDALAEAGIAESAVAFESGAFTRESGAAAMERLLRRHARPTAVFCLNDEMAVGAMRTVQSAGRLCIPQDISIMGFDDIPWCTAVHPHLTTVQVDKLLMGRLAVQRLFDRLSQPNHTPTTTVVDPVLIVRETTAAPAAG